MWPTYVHGPKYERALPCSRWAVGASGEREAFLFRFPGGVSVSITTHGTRVGIAAYIGPFS
jgi:hypothetical protein